MLSAVESGGLKVQKKIRLDPCGEILCGQKDFRLAACHPSRLKRSFDRLRLLRQRQLGYEKRVADGQFVREKRIGQWRY
jgi:hypothetical protein